MKERDSRRIIELCLTIDYFFVYTFHARRRKYLNRIAFRVGKKSYPAMYEHLTDI